MRNKFRFRRSRNRFRSRRRFRKNSGGENLRSASRDLNKTRIDLGNNSDYRL
jgi:hypothetical protein